MTMTTTMTGTCALDECGRPFERVRRSGRPRLYCSDACRDRAKAGPRAVRRGTCGVCGSAWEARGQRATVTRHCSPECAAEAVRIRDRARSSAVKPPCRQCGGEVPVGRRVTCSTDCREAERADAQRLRREADAETVGCALPGCSTRFLRRSGGTRYCSTACRGSARTARDEAAKAAARAANRVKDRSAVWTSTCARCDREFSWLRSDPRGRARRVCDSCRLPWHGSAPRIADDPDRVTRLGVLDRDGWVCHLCGFRIPPDSDFEFIDWTLREGIALRGTWDHVRPRLWGGDDSWSNAAAAHQGCNSGKREDWDGVSGSWRRSRSGALARAPRDARDGRGVREGEPMNTTERLRYADRWDYEPARGRTYGTASGYRVVTETERAVVAEVRFEGIASAIADDHNDALADRAASMERHPANGTEGR